MCTVLAGNQRVGTMTVIRYMIKTEHCAPSLVAKHFDVFDLVRGDGYWRGKHEQSISITILGAEADLEKIMQLAHEIRTQYQQDEVWITYESVTLRRVLRPYTLSRAAKDSQ